MVHRHHYVKRLALDTVKVATRVENCTDCLSVLYFVYLFAARYICFDILLLVSRSSEK